MGGSGVSEVQAAFVTTLEGDWEVLTGRAISRYRQNALASSICRGVLHCTWNKAGLATMTAVH